MDDKGKFLKKAGIVLCTVLLFWGIAYAFVPQVFSGKVVSQSDIAGYQGMSHEISEWNAAHPDNPTRWTDSMFGGMPATIIESPVKGDWTTGIFNFMRKGWFPGTYLFISLIGAFLLMLSLGVSWLPAIGGAVAVTFCSYNPQIIQVGHNTKMLAIAYMPWVLAALTFTYRSALSDVPGKRVVKTVAGAAFFGLALDFQIKANHQQITYYLALVILLYAIVQLLWVLLRRRDRFKAFAGASGLLLVLGVAGIACNANQLMPLYEYTAHTMRGGSELSSGSDGTDSHGLDIDYATAWSYGWEELPNLMIPDFNGGASAGAVDPDKSATIKLLRSVGQGNLRETAKYLPMYWGPQPFTAGPMYMGAITIFLFVLGLLLYRGRDKWWLVSATVLAVLLALGSHFMAFTRLCFNILPMYNKFRTVSMALVVLQVTLPALGFMTLDRILRGGVSGRKLKRAVLAAFAVTGGFCLVCALFPGIAGSFSGAADAGQPDILVDAFKADRKMLLRNDAWMSLLFIALAAAMLFVRRRAVAAAAVGVLVLVNMFTVGKRYLNGDDFTTPEKFASQFDRRAADEYILKDPALSCRVLDLTVNVFNDSHPSYWHKSIGGYSAAKLQRYQDLIDHYLTAEIQSVSAAVRKASTLGEAEESLPRTPILDALNTKYFIVDGNLPPVLNGSASGNAWFVSSAVPAATPDEEITLTGLHDLLTEAVVGDDFREARDRMASTGAPVPGDTIYMTRYAPDEVAYRYRAESDRTAVFSEIFYPEGWSARLEDGTETGIFRADWIFRAAVLPAGEHEIVMRFDPPSYRVGERVSRASSVTLIIVLLASLSGCFFLGETARRGKRTQLLRK